MRILIHAILIAACVFAASAATADQIKPIYMSNSAIGGGDLNQYTRGVACGTGVNNIGLLIRTFGKVTYVNTTSQFFYIDDGWGKVTTLPPPDNCTVTGVRISYGGLAEGVPAITPPAVNTHVAVTGVVSTVMIGGLVYPNVRVRGSGDITSF